MKIKSTSLLRFARLLDIEGVECWEMPEVPTIDPDPTDSTHRVDQFDRLDRISKNHYGTSDFARLIAVANGIDFFPSGLVPGAILRIPSPNRVAEIMRAASRRKEGR